jgi:chemotaxis protein histidine kinase CheA
MTREDILRALRDEFRENTRFRLVEMHSLLERIELLPDAATLRELERHFHGLAGLGGTYGYQSVTSLSREGENICESGAPNPDAVDYSRLAGIVSRIAGAIEEAPDSE